MNAKLEDLKEEIKSKEVKNVLCLIQNIPELYSFQNDFKSLEEACDEIALFDDEELIPYLVGEVFIYQDVEKTQVFFVYIVVFIALIAYSFITIFRVVSKKQKRNQMMRSNRQLRK